MTIQQILIKYWGHPEFRPLQQDIIESALSGRDTLALLPTGGGKSICFQVPALAKEGICLVISPLIALMKDQVENLQKKGIPALCVTSGMNSREIDIALDNCAYGNFKFLYVSPERLGTELFRERVKKMKVNLIAVDEAHCISQWGYDFRPAYLQIAEIRQLKPETPVLALTASATPEVVEDIQKQLQFKKTNVLQKSFARKNLAYVALKEEDKFKRMLKVIENVKGTGIVYVRNRRKTKEISDYLNRLKISADYYHAGLPHDVRNQKQTSWSSGKKRIMVSTNAFGMGIDVPGVRFVIHMDLPDSPEAYFQEAGRGGRDGKKAYSVVLFNETDRLDMERRLSLSFPEISEIKRTYHALGNYFQLAIGNGKEQVFDFDINRFCKHYRFSNPAIVYNALGFLEKEGYISSTESVFNPSRLLFLVSKENLYRFQVKNPVYDRLIKVILRSYTGLFDNYSKISEQELADRSKFSLADVKKMLVKMDEMTIVSYLPQNSHPKITFICERLDEKDLVISARNYAERKKLAERKARDVWNYLTNDEVCRSQQLLAYFGEESSVRCGICDICLERNKMDLNELEFEEISHQLENLLKTQPLPLEQLVDSIPVNHKEKVVKVIQWLMDHHHLREGQKGLIEWQDN